MYTSYWKYPISYVTLSNPIPMAGHPGSFAALRKHDKHTGVDIYVDGEVPIFSVENGAVVAIEEDFTGPTAGSPWWLPTKSILVEGKTGVVCYGEVKPSPDLKIGSFVRKGQIIANVVPVLPANKVRSDIKNHSRYMLHVEHLAPGTKSSAPVWKLEEKKMPKGLLDPTAFLLSSWLVEVNKNFIDHE